MPPESKMGLIVMGEMFHKLIGLSLGLELPKVKGLCELCWLEELNHEP